MAQVNKLSQTYTNEPLREGAFKSRRPYDLYIAM